MNLKTYFSKNPYPVYDQLRKYSPVHSISDEKWLITGYDSAVELLDNPACTHWNGSHNSGSNQEYDSIEGILNSISSECSKPYRKRIMHSLAAKNIRLESDAITTIAEKLVYNLRKRNKIDLIEQYAHPFTFTTIGRIIGFDTEQIKYILSTVSVDGSYLSYARQMESKVDAPFINSLSSFISDKRKNPTDDLGSHLIAECDLEGESHTFILSMFLLLFYAGHINMMNFIGLALASLGVNKSAQNEIKKNPSLLNTGVDELLRFDSPLQFIVLFAKKDISISKKKIPAGSEILICVGSANRDSSVFIKPDEIDLFRKAKHLSYGYGNFRCIGARLAQQQASIGLSVFLTNTKSYNVKVNKAVLQNKIFAQRGFSYLPMRVYWNKS